MKRIILSLLLLCTIKIISSDAKEILKQIDTNEFICCICHECENDWSLVTSLCCNTTTAQPNKLDHVFHIKCINDWLLKNRNCPLCRMSIKNTLSDLIHYTRNILFIEKLLKNLPVDLQHISYIIDHHKLYSIDLNFNLYQNNPLIITILNQNYTLTKALLKNGANVNIQNRSQEAPIYLACKIGNIELVKLLLDYNVDYKISNMHKNTPLIIALFQKHIEIAKLLIQKKQDLNVCNIDGITALMIAAAHNLEEIVFILLQQNANPNLSMNNGDTALMKAVIYNNPNIVQLLLKNNANKNIKNKTGKTALDMATESGYNTIINLFKEK